MVGRGASTLQVATRARVEGGSLVPAHCSTIETVREAIIRWREDWRPMATRAFALRLTSSQQNSRRIAGGCELRLLCPELAHISSVGVPSADVLPFTHRDAYWCWSGDGEVVWASIAGCCRRCGDAVATGGARPMRRWIAPCARGQMSAGCCDRGIVASRKRPSRDKRASDSLSQRRPPFADPRCSCSRRSTCAVPSRPGCSAHDATPNARARCTVGRTGRSLPKCCRARGRLLRGDQVGA
jgi:hypothetical protein